MKKARLLPIALLLVCCTFAKSGADGGNPWADAVMAFDAGNYSAAKKSLESISESERLDEALFLLGEIYLNEGNTPKAREYLLKMGQTESGGFAAYTELAMAGLVKADLINAIGNYNGALDVKADSVLNHFLKGYCFYLIPDFEKSLEAYESALKIKPDFYPGNMQIGMLLSTPARYDKALPYFKRYLEDAPAPAINIIYRTGRSYLVLGEYEKSIKMFKWCMEMTPHNPKIVTELAAALAKLGRYDEVITVLEDNLKHYPYRMSNRSHLINVYILKNDLENARRHALEAVKLNQNYLPAWYELGLIARKEGKIDAAREHFNKALEIDPMFEKAQRALKELQ